MNINSQAYSSAGVDPQRQALREGDEGKIFRAPRRLKGPAIAHKY